MKHILLPTLIMHVLLIAFALLTMNEYPALFLGGSVLALLLHIAWVIEIKGAYFPAHSLGLLLHILVQVLGIIRGDSGAFGLGGGGFALFFFDIALGASYVSVSIISLVRWYRAQ